jgi:pimeloyl-ACP methyl ester carboxylesterase
MDKQVVTYKSSHICYYRIGTGPKLGLCFHGYGEDATSFAFLEELAGSQYTFYAIDLPFHGQTSWKEDLNFTHTDLQQIIHDLLLANNINLQVDAPKPHKKIVLIGFSLGGRVALSLYQAWPQLTERLVLMAPDGLKVNFWYWLSTRTWAGNKLFDFTMKYPRWFFTFLKVINKLGMVNTSIFKFVNFYIGNKEARIQLYERWTTLRRLKPNIKRIKTSILQNKTPVRMIYGRHDRIILPIRGEKFKEGIEAYCTLKVIASGHQVLHEKHGDEILQSLKD